MQCSTGLSYTDGPFSCPDGECKKMYEKKYIK